MLWQILHEVSEGCFQAPVTVKRRRRRKKSHIHVFCSHLSLWQTDKISQVHTHRAMSASVHTPLTAAPLLPFSTDDLFNPKDGARSSLISPLRASSGCCWLPARTGAASCARSRHRGPGQARLAETSAPSDRFNKICSRSSL